MHVQDFLRNGGTPEQLTEKYAIKVKRHSRFPNLLLFKYDQIDSPMYEPLVQECRGLILDESNSWAVVSRPFDKFFNAEEVYAAPIDWKTARVTEKLDGSLVQLYFYKGGWHFATSGTPDAGGVLNDTGRTFAELIQQVWSEMKYIYPFPYWEKYTFLFELLTPFNQVVVPQTSNRLVLIGIRNNETGQELQPNVCEGTYEIVRTFPLFSLDGIREAFKNMDGLHQEGFVVSDKNFHRVKVKHPQYVIYHHLVGSLTNKKVLDTVRHGETAEVLAYFPGWAATFNEIRERYENFVHTYEEVYEGAIWYNETQIPLRAVPVQKDFALIVGKLGMPTAPFFAVRSGKYSNFRHYFAEARLETLAEWIGVSDNNQNTSEV